MKKFKEWFLEDIGLALFQITCILTSIFIIILLIDVTIDMFLLK